MFFAGAVRSHGDSSETDRTNTEVEVLTGGLDITPGLNGDTAMKNALLIGTISAAIALFGVSAFAQDEPPVVKVTLKNGDLGFKELTVKGETRFEIENAGTKDHAFEIEGKIGDKEFEIASPVLKPGEKSVIIVGLPAGKYEVYCPVADHKEMGMAGEITFAAE